MEMWAIHPTTSEVILCDMGKNMWYKLHQNTEKRQPSGYILWYTMMLMSEQQPYSFASFV